jgi:WD40 repeat protein
MSEPVQLYKGNSLLIFISHCIEHTQAVTCAKFTKDGQMLSGSMDSTVKLWDLNSSTSIRSFGSSSPVTGLVTLNSSKFITTSTDATMSLCDINARETILHTFYAHTQAIYGIQWDSNNKLLTYGEEKNWKLWKFTQNQKPTSLKDCFK